MQSGARLRGIDPRLFQIGALASLLTAGAWRYDIAVAPGQIAVTLMAALAMQSVFARWNGEPFAWRSAVITALSLSLLLRSQDAWLWAVSGVLAIGGKFLLRVNGKHLFNPVCFAIVSLRLMGAEVWVSPGQWGALAWDILALAALAALVLSAASRIDIALAFLMSWAALLAARCLSLGDPWTIPLHQLRSGALLVFTFFMITDPRSTPDSRAGRCMFAVAVASLGYWLQFHAQLREGLFYALICVSMTTPLLDRVFPACRFTWTMTSPEPRCA